MALQYMKKAITGCADMVLNVPQTNNCIRAYVGYHRSLSKVYSDHSKTVQHVTNHRSTKYFITNIKLYSSQNSLRRITSKEYEKYHSKENLRELRYRKATSADIPDLIAKRVTLLGWIEKCHESKNFFIVDGYGKTLCTIPTTDHVLLSTVQKLAPLDIICVTGSIVSQPETTNKLSLVIENILSLNHTKECRDHAGGSCNTFTYRTHTCGDLRPDNVGQNVTLCGWLQYQRMSKFLLLRDAYGLVQCVILENTDAYNIPIESVLKVKGTVAIRPSSMINHSMATGDIEVVVNSLEILNLVENIPFTLRQHQKPKEQLRLQSRYVDLRFPEMQNNLRLRSQMLHRMRSFLIDNHSFVEVETPTLFCRTPGGAREFVVPTHHSGLFYSLVQSPQQFKQMLMVGGLDRYFQVARCYRDETTRPDRQPEFTQLDIELSFSNVDGVLNLIEQLLYLTYPLPISKPPFKRITYREALETYGSDKPDISYALKFNNVTAYLENVHSIEDFACYAIVLPVELGKLSRKTRETIRGVKKRYCQVQTLDYHKLHEDVRHNISAKLQLDDSKSLFIALGPNDQTCLCLGEIRMILAEELISRELLELQEDICEPLWVVDFPLFVKGENGELETCHHPFTAPHPADAHLLDTEPLMVRGLAYDLVMNGNEVGGGSVRVHNADLQLKLLKMLNIDPGSMEHFIKALRSGCPPHAGIALGIDRMMALACNAESIRDVIAFPKSHEGRDPLSGAPNTISEDDRKYYHLNYAHKTQISND